MAQKPIQRAESVKKSTKCTRKTTDETGSLETMNRFYKEFHKTISFVPKHIGKIKQGFLVIIIKMIAITFEKKDFITRTLGHVPLPLNGSPNSTPMILNNAFNSCNRDRMIHHSRNRTQKRPKKNSQASMYLENALQTRKATLVEYIKYLCTPSTSSQGGAPSRTGSYLGVKLDTPKKLINYLTLKRLKWMS